MNWLSQRSSGELPLAIEDHDVENDVAPREHLCRDTPGAHRHFIAELNSFARGKREKPPAWCSR